MNRLRLIGLILLAIVLATTAWAKIPTSDGGFHRDRPTPRPMITDNTSRIDVNNIEMIVTNHGSFSYDLTQQSSGMWFPKGTEKTCVYASGLWVGCQVGGQIRIAAGSYAQEYGPGPILPDGSWDNAADPRHKVYKISKGDTTSDDYVNWPIDLGAPVDDQGKPLFLGDQTLWCVYNDADPELHNTDEGSTDPLGIEIQQTTFAFDWKGALGNTVFVKFKIINKGTNRLDSTYVAVWADPDLGGASDDYVGCDTDLSVGFVYNATNNDQLYGSNPPAVGFDFFQGPIGDGGEELPMVSFNKYINGTDPRSFRETYNYMRGLSLSGAAVKDPTTGGVTRFMVPGDPVANTGWLDSDPADRRFMINSGPFTMAVGDTQEVVIGIVVGQGRDRIGSVRVMKFYDQTAQVTFDLDFDLPEPPVRPAVDAVALDRKIRLSWGDDSEIHPGDYAFEGYNVYQSASVSAAGPWKLIATYDLVNGVQTIEDKDLNIEFGLPIVQPVQFGTDYGMQRYIEITEDKVLGVPLSNGTPYYFRVGAYSYNATPDEGLPKTLESSSSIAEVIPQEEASDAIIMTELDECTVVHGRVDDDIAPSTDKVNVFVADPFALTGDTYRFDFQHVSPPETLIAGADTTLVNYLWNLKNKNSGLYLYDSWQTNKTGNGDYLVTDGFVAKMIGSHTEGGLQDAVYVGPDGCHKASGLTSVDAGLDIPLNGRGPKGVGYGVSFGFGSQLDPVANADQFTTVEIRFSHTDTQKAYRYTRPGYAFTGFLEVPFTVWDANTGEQLNAAFVEWTGSTVYDDTWTPSATDDGGREYLFIMRSEYDPEGGVYDDDNWAPELDNLYVLWLRLESASSRIEDGSILRIVWGRPSTDNDYFEFTPEARQVSTSKAKEELAKIRVVPNPYFAHSSYELNQFSHVIKFSNLPAKCTIRIFNLAGDLVKTLEKNNADTSIMEWNLFNEGNLPVASGFYVYHVDAPGIGTTFGKMAIFLERERLNTF
jgi:hypothetical protein